MFLRTIRDFFHPQHDVATDVEYYCYDCYRMFHCNVNLNGTDWNRLTVICKQCKGKQTTIHKVNGTVVTAN